MAQARRTGQQTTPRPTRKPVAVPGRERDQPKTSRENRRLAATLFISLDGVVEDPHKWSFPYWNDEIGKFKFEETFASDALLLGRVTYEGFAAAWPGRKDPEGFADRFNSMPKYVASKTMTKLEWNNSHLIRGDLPREVSKLKKEGGRDIVIHGSPGLIRSLLPHGLIDEYRLLVYPIVLGKGKRLFDEASQVKLKLVDSKTFSTGVVKMVYEPADLGGETVPGKTAATK
jgi:dihydrofolate reductase